MPRNTLVMGPWYHGGWARSDGDLLGDVRFDAPTARHYREQIELPFFKRYLKGTSRRGAGRRRTCSRRAATSGARCPVAAARCRGEDALLPRERRAVVRAADGRGGGATTYVSDPARPVPFIEDVEIGMTREYMVADQRFASRRPDVLVYQTEPLEEELTLAGPIAAALVVSTSGTDSDFVVKLVDVYPDDAPDPTPAPSPTAEPSFTPRYTRMGGYQQLVRGEPFRGKFRNSFEKPEPFTPGAPTKVEFTLPDVFHTFRRGHRVMVQVQSSWFPLVDRNPQTFVNIRQAKPEDFKSRDAARLPQRHGALRAARAGAAVDRRHRPSRRRRGDGSSAAGGARGAGLVMVLAWALAARAPGSRVTWLWCALGAARRAARRARDGARRDRGAGRSPTAGASLDDGRAALDASAEYRRLHEKRDRTLLDDGGRTTAARPADRAPATGSPAASRMAAPELGPLARRRGPDVREASVSTAGPRRRPTAYCECMIDVDRAALEPARRVPHRR